MNCDELRPDYTSFALGITEEPERGEIADHLARSCPHCLPGVTSAMATVSAMSGAVKLTEPPKALRTRVLSLVERKPRKMRMADFIPWAIAAALSIVLVTIGVSGRRQIGDTEKLQNALSILNDPTTKDAAFGQAGPRGRIFVSPSKGIVFIAANLPRLDANKTFQLWAIPASGNPVSKGVFRSLPDSTAVFVQEGAVMNAAVIAVTIEPEGGSPQPTTTPFIASKL